MRWSPLSSKNLINLHAQGADPHCLAHLRSDRTECYRVYGIFEIIITVGMGFDGNLNLDGQVQGNTELALLVESEQEEVRQRWVRVVEKEKRRPATLTPPPRHAPKTRMPTGRDSLTWM